MRGAVAQQPAHPRDLLERPEQRHPALERQGSEARPMTDAELGEKFMRQAVPQLGEVRARKLQDALWKLESLSSVAELLTLARV